MNELITVSNLSKSFVGGGKFLRRRDRHLAVDDVSFTVERGRVMALVGESGAGKSTIGRLVLRLIEPDSGTIDFDGVDVRAQSIKQLRALRRRMQMIFQDPYSSLNPRMTVAEAVAEPLLIHFDTESAARRRAAADVLDQVGLGRQFLERYPVELSGGQLQRVAIARALALKPDFIVCDEPTAALDVSVQAQVLGLLTDLQRDLGLSMLFVTHDLALVQAIADDVVVLSKGRVIEQGLVSTVLSNPVEEYTKQLLASVPRPIPRSLRSSLTETQVAHTPSPITA